MDKISCSNCKNQPICGINAYHTSEPIISPGPPDEDWIRMLEQFLADNCLWYVQEHAGSD